MKMIPRLLSALALVGALLSASAQTSSLKLGVGLFQPDKERNDATYKPLAQYLATTLGRTVELRASTSGTAWPGRLPTAKRQFAPVVLNNGAAGMPNFRGRAAGLWTRVALRPFDGAERVPGLARDGVGMDAIEICYDEQRRAERFRRQWPEGSDAHTSYSERIAAGPAYDTTQALITSED